jgi:hypothetical protein
MNLVPINEFAIVFISYDEPNADDNWYDLLDKCPWAKRSHGVYGSDAAHKAAATLCDTDRIITVDADNIVDPNFFNLEIDLDLIGKNDVISWAAKDEINGLAYGNGGIKCWPKHVIHSMRTHENAPEGSVQAQVDFCWDVNYVQMNNVYSHVYNNASPLQAWRAGFREGVKMTLDNGTTVDKVKVKKVHPLNFKRLLVWQTIGADTLNGLWAIYGARQGCVMTNLQQDDWDWKDVRDFKWLNNFWANEVAPQFEDILGELCEKTGYSWNKDKLQSASIAYGQQIRTELGLPVAELDEQASVFFKEVYVNPARVHPLSRENEVINGVKE